MSQPCCATNHGARIRIAGILLLRARRLPPFPSTTSPHHTIYTTPYVYIDTNDTAVITQYPIMARYKSSTPFHITKCTPSSPHPFPSPSPNPFFRPIHPCPIRDDGIEMSCMPSFRITEKEDGRAAGETPKIHVERKIKGV